MSAIVTSLSPKQALWAEKKKQQLLSCYDESKTEQDWNAILSLASQIVKSGRHHPAVIVMVRDTLKQMESWEQSRDDQSKQYAEEEREL